MFMQLFFSKVHPACHNIANSIKPGGNSKKTDKHAAECSKELCMLGLKVIYVRCINCSYNNVAKGYVSFIKKHFLFIQEKSHASKSF